MLFVTLGHSGLARSEVQNRCGSSIVTCRGRYRQQVTVRSAQAGTVPHLSFVLSANAPSNHRELEQGWGSSKGPSKSSFAASAVRNWALAAVDNQRGSSRLADRPRRIIEIPVADR